MFLVRRDVIVSDILIMQGYDSSRCCLHGLLRACLLQIAFICIYSTLVIYVQGQHSEQVEPREDQ